MLYRGSNNVVCWRRVFKTVPVCVSSCSGVFFSSYISVDTVKMKAVGQDASTVQVVSDWYEGSARKKYVARGVCRYHRCMMKMPNMYV